HAAEAMARAAISDRLAACPWMELLQIARTHGEAAAGDVRGRVAADQELLPPKERKRAEREGDEQAKRASRRAASQALDEGLALVGLWLRDVACVADGAAKLVHHSDRLEALREDASVSEPHRLREGVGLVDDTRASLILNPSEELALEGLVYRLALTLS
ncbi:MAG: hypothetical protein JWM71_1022, partial [Solirubrobacteraceae bacterium]|nr:hypothetical protein [Solirubrobacteraceae bacterium]